MNVVGKAGGHQEIAPVPLGQGDGLAEQVEATLADLHDGVPESIDRLGGRAITEREIAANLALKESFCRFEVGSTEEDGQAALGDGTERENGHL